MLTDGTNGIPATNFTRAIREDPDRKGLLYAGTEFGLYISFDDGRSLAAVPTELAGDPGDGSPRPSRKPGRVDAGDALSGFSTTSRRFIKSVMKSRARTTGSTPPVPRSGEQASGPATVDYYLKDVPEGEITLDILDANGDSVRTYHGEAGDEPEPESDGFFSEPDVKRIPVKQGLNRFNWNLREKGPELPEGVVHWGGTPGLRVVPGAFEVRLTVGEWSQTRPLAVALNPSVETTVRELRKQYELGKEVASEIELLFGALTDVRDVKAQSAAIVARTEKAKAKAKADEDNEEIAAAAKALDEKLTAIEEKIHSGEEQVRPGSDQLSADDRQPAYDPLRLHRQVGPSTHGGRLSAFRRFEARARELARRVAGGRCQRRGGIQ